MFLFTARVVQFFRALKTLQVPLFRFVHHRYVYIPDNFLYEVVLIRSNFGTFCIKKTMGPFGFSMRFLHNSHKDKGELLRLTGQNIQNSSNAHLRHVDAVAIPVRAKSVE